MAAKISQTDGLTTRRHHSGGGGRERRRSSSRQRHQHQRPSSTSSRHPRRSSSRRSSHGLSHHRPSKNRSRKSSRRSSSRRLSEKSTRKTAKSRSHGPSKNRSRRQTNVCQKCGIDRVSQEKYWKAVRNDRAMNVLAVMQLILELLLLCHLSYWAWLAWQHDDLFQYQNYLMVEFACGALLFIMTVMLATDPYAFHYFFVLLFHLGLSFDSFFAATFQVYNYGYCNDLTVRGCMKATFMPWKAVPRDAVKLRQTALIVCQVVNIVIGEAVIILTVIGLWMYMKSTTRLRRSKKGAALIARMLAHCDEGREGGAQPSLMIDTNAITYTPTTTNQPSSVTEQEGEGSPHRRITGTAVMLNLPHQWVHTTSRYSEVEPINDQWTRVCVERATKDQICSLYPRTLAEARNVKIHPVAAEVSQSTCQTPATARTSTNELQSNHVTFVKSQGLPSEAKTQGKATSTISAPVLSSPVAQRPQTVFVRMPLDNLNITKMAPQVSPIKYLERLEANGYSSLVKPRQYPYQKNEK